MRAGVNPHDRGGQLADARQRAPRLRVVGRDDVVAQLADRGATQVMRLDAGVALLVQRLDQGDHGGGIEPALGTRLLDASRSATAVVELKALEQRGGGRALRHELAERG